MDSSIERELESCKSAAEEGYASAKANYDDIRATLNDAAQKLLQAEREQNEVKRIQNTELITRQKDELRRLTDEVKKIGDGLQSLRESTKIFSIVVYGRTEAGKSTLMEILTHGNGQSIGKGKQRTTLDVRDYFWNGLKITDVPGVCAFDGAVDETKALAAAKAADLILFLIRSDGVQPDEAEKLAQLRNLGKPVLGVINVQKSFPESYDELDVEDLQEALAKTKDINDIVQQFKEFAALHNQDWRDIKFVATHLLSAYLTQDKDPTVFNLSRFAEVEDFILEKVRRDGRFLRIKTFADAVAVPMSNLILKIYEQSARSLLESKIWFEKTQELGKWSENFSKRAKERMETLYTQSLEKIDAAIYNFSEKHYEDDRAGEHWQKKFKSLKLDEDYQKLLNELAGECERKRRELSDELTQKLSKMSIGDAKAKVSLDSTIPWTKVGGGILSGVGGFILARGASFVFPPLGIALTVIGILGAVFGESTEETIKKNKKKIRDAITEPSHDALKKIHGELKKVFNEKIWKEGVCDFWDLLAKYQFMTARLGKSQYELAAKLFGKFTDLNFKLLREAAIYKSAGAAQVSYIPRIPGERMLILAARSNLDTKKISELLGEKILVMKPEKNFYETLKNILGVEFQIKSYRLALDTEEKKAECAFAFFPKSKVDATNFKLAQQIAGRPIIMR